MRNKLYIKLQRPWSPHYTLYDLCTFLTKRTLANGCFCATLNYNSTASDYALNHYQIGADNN